MSWAAVVQRTGTISGAPWAAALRHRRWGDSVSLCKHPSGDPPRGYLEEIFKETGGPMK